MTESSERQALIEWIDDELRALAFLAAGHQAQWLGWQRGAMTDKAMGDALALLVLCLRGTERRLRAIVGRLDALAWHAAHPPLCRHDHPTENYLSKDADALAQALAALDGAEGQIRSGEGGMV